MESKSQPIVLLSASLWWPASARLAMAFLESGCGVAAICPVGHPLRFVRGVAAVFPYRGLRPTGSLMAAIRVANPDLIVPCDDGAAWHLRELHRGGDEFRSLIERSLGGAEAYAIVRSRYQVMQAASEMGIRVPAMRSIMSSQDLNNAAIEWPAVLKTDGSWGGEGVAIVRNASQAERFVSLIRTRRSRGAWKRFLVNRHPLALWMLRRNPQPAITLQKFVPGRQATTMFACWKGEVLASVTVEVLATAAPAGAGTVVRPLANEAIEQAARLLARRFMLSGLHGLDFILENATENAYLIEINPRATQLGHLNLSPQGSLANAIAVQLAAPPSVQPARISSDTVALFPSAWKTDPEDPRLITGYHDVPWEQPALVHELMQAPWPDRRWLSRISDGLFAQKPRQSAQNPRGRVGTSRL